MKYLVVNRWLVFFLAFAKRIINGFLFYIGTIKKEDKRWYRLLPIDICLERKGDYMIIKRQEMYSVLHYPSQTTRRSFTLFKDMAKKWMYSEILYKGEKWE